jgi:hypothetical protein
MRALAIGRGGYNGAGAMTNPAPVKFGKNYGAPENLRDNWGARDFCPLPTLPSGAVRPNPSVRDVLNQEKRGREKSLITKLNGEPL